MPSFRSKRIVPYTADEVVNLVADVERYPEFVPLCESLTVGSRTTTPDGLQTIVARMTVGYGPVRESFVSRVLVDRAGRRIDVAYLEGPFRSMQNVWLLRPLAVGCEVDFFVDYEFRSLPLQMLMGTMFDKAFRKLTQAFEKRAAQIYGPRAARPPVRAAG